MDYTYCNHLFQSNILPFHGSLPFSTGSFKGHPCRVSSCKNFPHFNQFWQSRALGTIRFYLTSLPPHPSPVFHPSLNSVKGLLSITCTFIWCCAESERTDVAGRGLFWRRAKVAKIRENILPAFSLKCRLNMKNDATSAGFIFKLIIFLCERIRLRLKTKSLQ